MDVYAIERSQEQCTVIGGNPEVYEERCVGTFFYVYLSTNVNTMFGSLANLTDLNKAPNLADVPPGHLGFTYMSFDRIDGCSREVDQAPVCEILAYLPGSVHWAGTLTSVVSVGEALRQRKLARKTVGKRSASRIKASASATSITCHESEARSGCWKTSAPARDRPAPRRLARNVSGRPHRRASPTTTTDRAAGRCSAYRRPSRLLPPTGCRCPSLNAAGISFNPPL